MDAVRELELLRGADLRFRLSVRKSEGLETRVEIEEWLERDSILSTGTR